MSDYRSVLFLIADDWSRIAKCYGDNFVQTPNIDRLAEQGVVFDYAFCTSQSCAVSRACILTGQHSHTHGQYGHCHGIHGFRTHDHMQSIPKILKMKGFATGCIGKKHVEPSSVTPLIMNHLLILVVQKISLMLLVNFLPMSKISHFIYISVVVIRIGQEVATEMKRSMLEFSQSDMILT